MWTLAEKAKQLTTTTMSSHTENRNYKITALRRLT